MLKINKSASGFAFVSYNRADALSDKALIPVQFSTVDGSSEWMNTAGDRDSVPLLSEADPQKVGSAITTAVKTEIGDEILARTVHDFQRQLISCPRSKMLIVVSNIAEAKRRRQDLSRLGIDAPIATSDQGRQARENIRRFRYDPQVKALVTVAMAYEGLNVPAITHIACLTHFRSKPWLEQLFARATRFDPDAGPYEKQTAFIFTPDDALMRQVIEEIRQEQETCALEPAGGGSDDKGLTQSLPNAELIPLSSVPATMSTFDFDSGTRISLDELRKAANDSGLKLQESQLKELQAALSASTLPSKPPESPREESERLRRSIEARTRTIALSHNVPPDMVNRYIKKRFGKSRADMSLEELRSVYQQLPTVAAVFKRR